MPVDILDSVRHALEDLELRLGLEQMGKGSVIVPPSGVGAVLLYRLGIRVPDHLLA